MTEKKNQLINDEA